MRGRGRDRGADRDRLLQRLREASTRSIVGRDRRTRLPGLEPEHPLPGGARSPSCSRHAEGDQVDVRERAPQLWEALTADVERVVQTLRDATASGCCAPATFHPDELDYLGHLQGGHSLLYPADPTFVLGKHVIETCIRRPFRRKEAWATRDVLMPHIERGPVRAARGDAAGRAAPRRRRGPGTVPRGRRHHRRRARRALRGHRPDVQRPRVAPGCAATSRRTAIRVHPVDVQGTWLHLLGRHVPAAARAS